MQIILSVNHILSDATIYHLVIAYTYVKPAAHDSMALFELN